MADGSGTHDLGGELVPVDELRQYIRNPRKGNVPRIRESLRENGQVQALCVNRGTLTGRPNEVLGGNHTLQAAIAEGMTELWCSFVDVGEAQAARIVAVLNRTADFGEYDDRLLAELLSHVDDELGTLQGTGYDLADLELIERNLNGSENIGTNPEDEWDGMPEFESEDQLAWQTIKVHLRNEADRDELAQLLGQKLGDRTKYVWHPAAEKDDVADLAYVAGDDQED